MREEVPPGLFASRNFGSTLESTTLPADHPLMKWMRAVKASKAYRYINYTADAAWRNYVLDPIELWAMSYAQWIALRSGDPDLAAQLHDQQQKHATYSMAWPNEDFEPIAEAMDEVFRSIGWLRERTDLSDERRDVVKDLIAMGFEGDALVAEVMERTGVNEVEAEFIIGIEMGEIESDVVLIESDEMEPVQLAQDGRDDKILDKLDRLQETVERERVHEIVRDKDGRMTKVVSKNKDTTEGE
jgi:hypothetical protein